MRSPLLAGSLVGLAVLLAACGGAAAAPAASVAPATAAPATAAPATTAPEAGAAAIALADTSLGSVLTGAGGLTLYMFTADSGGTSSCYDSCAQSWPPVLGAAQPGAGLDAADFGTTARTDGTTQVTFNGMPLYAFAGDKAAGDVNGQGVGGKWFVLGADGQPIK
jgi:predicted lipoprotein with Yx(FWY)xxD motif